MRVNRAFILRRLLPGAVAAAALLSTGLFAAGCKSGNDTGGSGAGGTGGAASTEGDIRVGHYASLTGANATFGVDTREGVDLAVDEINAAGGINGRKIAVETQDDQSKADEAVTVVTRFANDDKIVAVIGEVASSISKAAAPVLEAKGIPMITPSSTNVEVTQVGPHIFRICFIDPFQGFVMAKFAKENLKMDRVAVFRDQANDYSVGLANEFTKAFQGMGGTVVKDVSYKQGDNDFRAQLSQIKGVNPQAIYVPGYYGDVGTIARQARELGITVPLMGGDGWDSETLIKGAGGPGGALEGSYFSNHFSKFEKAERVEKFVNTYRQKYNGKDPSGLAALGYDSVKILADAIKRAGSTDREAVTKAIAETKDFPGVTGQITIDENRNATKPAVVLRIKGNEFVYEATVTPGAESGGSASAANASQRTAAATGP